MKKLTQEYLKSRVHYDPKTGIFTWLPMPSTTFSNRSWNTRYAGRECGHAQLSGYVKVKIDRRDFTAHRLAFLYMTGQLPACEVDHVNHIRADNRWANLRAVSSQENGRNKCLPRANGSGVSGVKWYGSKLRVHIGVSNRAVYLGTYRNFFEAVCARKSAELNYGFHENHGAAAA